MNCGRTFNWLNQEEAEEEENPFIVSEDEQLPLSERKAEVEPEEIVHHDSSKLIGSSEKNETKKKDENNKEELTDEKRLEMLEDKFLTSEVSEETYKKLRKKFTTKILKSLDEKFENGEITAKKYEEVKSELE